MDLSTVFIALLVFGALYQAIGMALDAKKSKPQWNPGGQERAGSGLRDLISKLGQASFNKLLLKNARFRERLDLMLVRSGHVFGWKAADLLFVKELGGLIVIFALWYNRVTDPLAWIFGLFAGFMIPEFYVKSRASARQAEIQRNLPTFVDLAALALESGLDFMAAIERIVARLKPNALREELQSLMQENRLGTSRKEALQHLAHRAPIQDLQSLTGIIIQSEELGTSLAQVLRNYAEDMRSRRLLRAEEIAGKAPIKLLFPMVVFFFPIVFVIIFGPIALEFMRNKG